LRGFFNVAEHPAHSRHIIVNISENLNAATAHSSEMIAELDLIAVQK